MVLLRRGGKHADRALEVLLLKRSEEAKFMPGVWVFPGGAVDPGDGEGEAGYRACAVRELSRGGGDRAARRRGAGAVLALDHAGGDLDPLRRLVLPRPRPRPHAPRARRRRDHRGRLVPARPPRSRPRRPASSTLAFPTLSQLQSLVAFRTAEEAIAAHRDRAVEPILPKVIGTREDHRVVLPGDPDYPA